jgi:hypothetical protein
MRADDGPERRRCRTIERQIRKIAERPGEAVAEFWLLSIVAMRRSRPV